MKIENCTAEDIDEIFRLYGIASAYQKTKQTVVVWPQFERQRNDGRRKMAYT